MRYQGILFDADDTLFDFQVGNRNAVNALLDEIGYLHPDRYDQYEAVNLACWAELEQGRLTQDALRTERFRRFYAKYGIDRDPRQDGDRFVELLGGQSILLPHAEDVVREIAKVKPVLILTNGITSVQKRRLALSPIRDVISGAVISQEEGAAKPNPKLFDRALKRLGIARGAALMIGDGVNSDIRGANNAGIDACWYNPGGKVLPAGVHAEYIIDDIRQCVEIALR